MWVVYLFIALIGVGLIVGIIGQYLEDKFVGRTVFNALEQKMLLGVGFALTIPMILAWFGVI